MITAYPEAEAAQQEEEAENSTEKKDFWLYSKELSGTVLANTGSKQIAQSRVLLIKLTRLIFQISLSSNA